MTNRISYSCYILFIYHESFVYITQIVLQHVVIQFFLDIYHNFFVLLYNTTLLCIIQFVLHITIFCIMYNSSCTYIPSAFLTPK